MCSVVDAPYHKWRRVKFPKVMAVDPPLRANVLYVGSFGPSTILLRAIVLSASFIFDDRTGTANGNVSISTGHFRKSPN